VRGPPCAARSGHARVKRHDGTIQAEAPNQIWVINPMTGFILQNGQVPILQAEAGGGLHSCRLGRSVMMVTPLRLGSTGCHRGHHESVVLHWPWQALQGRTDALDSQPRPHFAMALAMKGRFLDRAADLADKFLICTGSLRAPPGSRLRHGLPPAPSALRARTARPPSTLRGPEIRRFHAAQADFRSRKSVSREIVWRGRRGKESVPVLRTPARHYEIGDLRFHLAVQLPAPVVVSSLPEPLEHFHFPPGRQKRLALAFQP